MTRASTDMDETARELAEHLATLRRVLAPDDDGPVDTALCSVETFCAVALRVMRKTNPSKIRSEARTVEIKARLDGTPVLRGAA
jgi:hypothetical protein